MQILRGVSRFLSKEKILFRGRSRYRYLTVVENSATHTRILYTGNRLFVAGVDLRTGFPLHSPYFLADIFVPRPKTLLFLGGGANAVPSYVWHTHHPKQIIVVDRDPMTTELAKLYFHLPQEWGYQIIHRDAYEFLVGDNQKYEVIFSNLGVTRRRAENPSDLFSLCSLIGIGLQAKHLKTSGVLVSTFIARLTGDDGLFAYRYFQRFKQIFPTCYLFSDYLNIPDRMQLSVILATHKKCDIHEQYKKFIHSPLLVHDTNLYTTLLGRLHKT